VSTERPAGEPTRLEFWPDYGGALLWAGGERVALDSLPLTRELVEATTAWLSVYDDEKMPWEATRDDAWLAEGRHLFEALRDALWDGGIELVAGEDHWRSSS
jgi:hypothetical protein